VLLSLSSLFVFISLSSLPPKVLIFFFYDLSPFAQVLLHIMNYSFNFIILSLLLSFVSVSSPKIIIGDNFLQI
jgi:hypothetical protein